ncbi:maltose ABC transporter permease MalF [Endozoicomonas sp. GU-1]|uniref:maltose ABC transporter permease MalF n=1 Tax=Endozoicomonas sp. GU-1 TaxID=3009078 RepID=UPI0022B36D45|nr:maltose ABC transporter permease MalF [Endozoicomonas sp. GU-1]WBA82226.1 maltose ABC transporter permease MalF [Endozoicomonas sp. GU-1]WBA85164.1 maltose ABC transporter permease MalF [Endozoicomonas sp. GU-1]
MTIPANVRSLLSGNGPKWALVALIDLALLYVIALLYFQGEVLFPLTLLVLGSLGTWIFTSKRGYSYRYVYPCLLGIMMFIVFPLVYTFSISFTNYGSANILSLERVKEIHLNKQVKNGEHTYTLALFQQNDQFQLQLTDKNDKNSMYTSDAFVLNGDPVEVNARSGADAEGNKLSMREVVQQRSALGSVAITLTDDTRLVMSSLREFSAMAPQYREEENDSLVEINTGNVIRPDMTTGFYVTDSGERVAPGFSVYVGGENYERMVNDKGIREPFFKIFVWTVVFSAGSVLFCLVIGLLLANLMQWEPLKERAIYRVLLILPYAVPAFISILIFKGLFNQNFGEINMILEGLFGISPEWMTDPTFARTMILIVNTWLGYPYMMIVCMGLLKAIPDDLYEASAIDGANPIHNLLYITLPNIAKPLAPILIASFAFNFNNFVLIDLLTAGGPMMAGTTTEAGFTDLLVNFTFRTAFVAGQDFGLASAIATMIFLIVGFISWVNLRATRSSQEY